MYAGVDAGCWTWKRLFPTLSPTIFHQFTPAFYLIVSKKCAVFNHKTRITTTVFWAVVLLLFVCKFCQRCIQSIHKGLLIQNSFLFFLSFFLSFGVNGRLLHKIAMITISAIASTSQWAEPDLSLSLSLSVILQRAFLCDCNKFSNESCNATTTQHSNTTKLARFSL